MIKYLFLSFELFFESGNDPVSLRCAQTEPYESLTIVTASDDISWIRALVLTNTSSLLRLVKPILATLTDQSVKSFRVVFGKL